MPFTVVLSLWDIPGQDPEGGGTWQVVVQKNGALLHDTKAMPYSGGKFSVSTPAGADWTHITITIVPELYALQGVKVNQSAAGMYRNNPNARISKPAPDTLRISLPLLRVREAPGVAPPSPLVPGDEPGAIWLARVPQTSFNVYRDVVLDALQSKSPVMSLNEVADATGFKSAIKEPDAPATDPWRRFQTTVLQSDPPAHGAPLLLEYGEVGSAQGKGARFLVAVWAPNWKLNSGAAQPPNSRDMALFYHPKTNKVPFPVSAFPFTKGYPYTVTGPDPTNAQGHVFQPYVNLALRHVFDTWSRFHVPARQAVFVSPIFPHPIEQKPDNLEYGLPFTTQEGAARLLQEVNVYLHQIRYGWSNADMNQWWGVGAPSNGMRRSPADDIHSYPDDFPVPPLGRVAVSAFSASSAELGRMLATPGLSNSRYPNGRWGTTDHDPLLHEWIETWALDPFLDATTVTSAKFEKLLIDWFGRNDDRRFMIANSGTTGGSTPGTKYPALRAAAGATKRYTSSDPTKFAEVWRGPSDRWLGLFCSNPYLRGPAPGNAFPQWPANNDPDLAHGFMYRLSIGLALSWSTLGR